MHYMYIYFACNIPCTTGIMGYMSVLLSRYMTLYCIGSMVPGTYIVPDTVSPHTGSGLRVSFLSMRVYRNVDVQIELCTGMLFGCDAVQFRS